MDKALAEAGKIFTTQNPDGTFSFVGNWFTYANLTLSTGLFGFTFLIACIVTAAYYVLVVVTDPSQQRRISENIPSVSLQNWNFERILHLIYFAYTTYTTLDPADVTCQSKIICELQETEGIVGKTTKRISNFLLFFDLFDTVPFITDYRNAARQGQRRQEVGDKDNKQSNGTKEIENKACEENYSSCKFSVHRFNQQYNSVFQNIDTFNFQFKSNN